MSGEATKRTLIKSLSRRCPELSESLVAKLADIIFSSIGDAVVGGGRVEVRGFGMFFAGEVRRRLLRHPRTGELLEAPACRRLRFKPGRRLRDEVNRGR